MLAAMAISVGEARAAFDVVRAFWDAVADDDEDALAELFERNDAVWGAGALAPQIRRSVRLEPGFEMGVFRTARILDDDTLCFPCKLALPGMPDVWYEQPTMVEGLIMVVVRHEDRWLVWGTAGPDDQAAYRRARTIRIPPAGAN